jgi:hypothetical protein
MMYDYIVYHRTQILLTDAQYARLKQESARTGAALGELVRRAVDSAYGAAPPAHADEILAATFGAWKDREPDGQRHVEGLRRGLGRRLAR